MVARDHLECGDLSPLSPAAEPLSCFLFPRIKLRSAAESQQFGLWSAVTRHRFGFLGSFARNAAMRFRESQIIQRGDESPHSIIQTQRPVRPPRNLSKTNNNVIVDGVAQQKTAPPKCRKWLRHGGKRGQVPALQIGGFAAFKNLNHRHHVSETKTPTCSGKLRFVRHRLSSIAKHCGFWKRAAASACRASRWSRPRTRSCCKAISIARPLIRSVARCSRTR